MNLWERLTRKQPAQKPKTVTYYIVEEKYEGKPMYFAYREYQKTALGLLKNGIVYESCSLRDANECEYKLRRHLADQKFVPVVVRVLSI